MKISARGFNLIETMIAMTVLLVGLVAVISVFTISISQNTNQGEFAMRNTQYAQDKMEQLLTLSFSDSTTNTTVYPPAATGGTGLGVELTPGATKGSVNSASPVSGYVDYLDASGKLLASSSGWFYKRQWSIALDSSSTLKTITVLATSKTVVGPGKTPVSTTLICYKSNTK